MAETKYEVHYDDKYPIACNRCGTEGVPTVATDWDDVAGATPSTRTVESRSTCASSATRRTSATSSSTTTTARRKRWRRR